MSWRKLRVWRKISRKKLLGLLILITTGYSLNLAFNSPTEAQEESPLPTNLVYYGTIYEPIKSTSFGNVTSADAMDEKEFNLEKLDEYFAQVLVQDDCVLDPYNKGFHQLYLMFCRMGTLFSFVGSDIEDKAKILHKFSQEDLAKERYLTCHDMISYEVDRNIQMCLNPPSGSRTLLRLHRSLEFIGPLLKFLSDCQPEDQIGSRVSEIYHDTLAKYHGWLVRKAAGLGFRALGTCDGFCKQLGITDLKGAQQILLNVAKHMESIHTASQKHFVQYNCLDLP